MINQLSLGLTALRAAQYGLDIVGNNIANASTPGYHRQLADLRNRTPVTFAPFQFGTGVELVDIRRSHSRILEQAITTNVANQGDTLIRLTTNQQVESVLAPRTGSLTDRVNALYSRFQELALHPDDAASRRAVVTTAVDLTNTLRSTSSDLDRIQVDVEQEIQGTVDRVNQLASQIVKLNGDIRRAKAQGVHPNDMQDQRDAAVNELAQYIDVRLDSDDDLVLAGDNSIVLGQNVPPALIAERGADGVVLRQGASGPAILPVGGRLAGLLALRNQILPQYQSNLRGVATGLVEVIDRQHVMGVGAAGGFQQLVSGRSLSSTTNSLDQLDTVVPITSGKLRIGVTDQTTGTRTIHEIDVASDVDSLADVAAKISAIPQLQAIVNSATGGLAITAAGGYTFDFAGGASTRPDVSGLAGTTVPTIAGIYSGTANTDFRFEFSGAGEVGVTDGLQLRVLDAGGNLIETLNVGAGYEAGSPLGLRSGLTVSLASGTVLAGDSFVSSAVATSDTSGFLTALGLNTFFVGNDPTSLAVDPRLVDSPNALGLSATGEVGDVTNLTRILDNRTAKVLASGEASVEQFLQGMISNVGEDVNANQGIWDGLGSLAASLDSQRAAISGVDPNEEAIQMLRYQQSFQAAARYLETVNQTTEEIFRIIS